MSTTSPQLAPSEALDLRLVAPAASAWLAAGVSGSIAIGASQASALGLAALGALALISTRRHHGRASGHRGVVAAAASWCAAGAMLAGSYSAAASTRGPLPALATQRVTVTLALVVTGDPHVSAASAGGPREIEVIAARAIEVTVGGRSTRIRSPIVLLAIGYGWSSLQPSQRLRATGTLVAATPGEHEAAVFEARGGPADVTDPSRVQRIAGRIRRGLRDAVGPLPTGPRGLLPGLVDGDTSGLSPQLQASFRATGLTHIVAVSGANVAIVLAAVLIAARWAGLRLRGRGVVGGLAIVGFVVVARPQPSVLRAAAMGLIVVVALATGRRASALPSLCGAVLVLLLVDPALSTSPGFALSVLASAGLVVLAPVIRDMLARRLPRRVSEAVAVPTAATLMCAPIIVMISGRVSLTSIPANLLAEPAVAPATVLGAMAACIEPVSLPVAQVLARAGGLPCRWLIWVAQTFAGLPGSTLRWPSGVRGAVLLALVLIAGGIGVAVGCSWHAAGRESSSWSRWRRARDDRRR